MDVRLYTEVVWTTSVSLSHVRSKGGEDSHMVARVPRELSVGMGPLNTMVGVARYVRKIYDSD